MKGCEMSSATSWLRIGKWTTCCLTAAMFVGSLGRATAQPPEKLPENAEPAIVNELTPDAIQTRLTKVQENKDLEPTVKTKVVETYGKIQEALKSIADANARVERFTRLAREVPQTLQTAQKELTAPVLELPLDLPTDTTLQQSQQRLTDVETQLAESQKNLKDLQDEPKRRADRRVEIPKLAETAKTQLQEIDQQLAVKPSPDEPVESAVANRLLLEAKRALIAAETAANQAEVRFYEAAAELLPVRRDLAARKVAQVESLAKRLRDEVNERRRKEAEEQAREARRVAAQAHPALKAIADRNAELAKLRQDLATEIEGSSRNLESLEKRLAHVDEQFTKISKRVEAGQQNPAIGLILRKQRSELPDLTSERVKMNDRADEVAAETLQLIEYEEERNELATLDKKVEDLLAGLESTIVPEERDVLELEIREMLQSQRNYLDAIIADSNNYVDKLLEQNARSKELIKKVEEFIAYCDERVFWIRSAPVLTSFPTADLDALVPYFTTTQKWVAAGRALWRECLTHPVALTTVLLIWITCLVFQKTLRRWLTDLGDQAARPSCRTMLPTVRALVLTVFIAVLWPALTGMVGLMLLSSQAPSEFVHSLGQGLVTLSLLFAALECLRQICRPKGLGESHFGWDSEPLQGLRKGCYGIMVTALPLALAVVITEAQTNESIKNGLGRVAFIVVNLLLLYPAYQLTQPTAGIFSAAYTYEPTAWWSRLKWGLHGLTVAGPIVLVGLAIGGYYYTAIQLSARILMTVWLMAGIVIGYGMMLRWSLIAYRNLGMQRLQERRAAAAESGSAVPANSQFETKLSDINLQTRKMLQWGAATGLAAGVWWIWVAVVPALGALRHVVLWQLETGTGGNLQVTAITLADLILSAIVLTLTFAISRSIPSLLELTLLKQLPLDAGARYAAGTVARYAITGTGITLAFAALGLEWSSVQWLVAAISVGLGFGLQEIFANFVSGLILLFERPIRIGDIVTVGDVEGKVSNIRMRATTITDWDMRELIVPNKELITGRVINWTLATTVSRMSINIGVAYGTDPDRVRDLLLDIAQKHPLVLKTPPSHALMDGFGNSTLNFVLRVHMPTRDVYLQLRHELMTQISNQFKEAGIVFAFPQQDVYLHPTEKWTAAMFGRPSNAHTNGHNGSEKREVAESASSVGN